MTPHTLFLCSVRRDMEIWRYLLQSGRGSRHAYEGGNEEHCMSVYCCELSRVFVGYTCLSDSRIKFGLHSLVWTGQHQHRTCACCVPFAHIRAFLLVLPRRGACNYTRGGSVMERWRQPNQCHMELPGTSFGIFYPLVLKHTVGSL